MALTKIIPSYLYVQYADDDTLQAFVSAYNEMAQDYLDTLNGLHLPIYTRDPVSGALLDWVALGLYGFQRPLLRNPAADFIGPFNTYEIDGLEFNGFEQSNPEVPPYVTDDDLFRRVITWHFYKGDGLVFNIRWLKRRVMRFLFGVNGVDYNVDETYRVSVTFGADSVVTIQIIDAAYTIEESAIFGEFEIDSVDFASVEFTTALLEPVPYAPILQEALASGVLETPFQFTFSVTSGGFIIL